MKTLTPSLLLLIILAGGAVAFKLATPNSCAGVRGDDTLFVLTGDSRRIPFAMNLLEYHTNRKLYIIGVGGDNYAATIPTKLKNNIEIESDSKSTFENSVAVRKFAEKNQLNRIVIVTTDAHMNRSMLLMRRQMPDKTIIACPITLKKMPPTERLAHWGMEYIKYIATLAGVHDKGS